MAIFRSVTNFNYYEPRFSNYAIRYAIFVVWRHQQRCAEADRDPQNIAEPRRYCRFFV